MCTRLRGLAWLGCVAVLLATAPALSEVEGQASTPPLPQPMRHDAALAAAREMADQFVGGRGEGLWERMAPVMHQALGDRARWAQIAAAIPVQIGQPTETLNDRLLPALQMQTYTRLIRTSLSPAPLVISIALMPDGRLAGIYARPVGNPAESKFLDYTGRTPLRVPLAGEWTIYQGGRSLYDNYHASFADQRFAYDIVAIRDGSLYRTDAGTLEDFHAYGQPVFAAADGAVASAEDAHPDNPLNQPSVAAPRQGNSVVIDHGNGEFSMYAHLKRGSVAVKAGDRVRAGQAIGQVGNSGNSPLPHLHFHLQNSAAWFQGEGLPVRFRNATVNGVAQADAEPVRGDTVRAN